MQYREICPFLGQKFDPDTCHLYPSRGNYCHAVKKPGRIRIAYQERVCLSGIFHECSVFKNESPQTLPEHIRLSSSPGRNFLWIGIVIGLLAAAASGFVLLRRFPLSGFLPGDRAGFPGEDPSAVVMTETLRPSPSIGLNLTGTNTASPTSPPDSATPSPVVSPGTSPAASASLVPSREATLIPTSPAVTPFPTTGPELETRFGPEDQFLIHSMQAGQSYAYLERYYQTTREVIEATNQLYEGASLWPGTLLVILPGVAEVPDLPRFVVYFVEKPIDIVELAGMYSCTVDEIRYYNELGIEETIQAGRWLIIPVGE